MNARPPITGNAGLHEPSGRRYTRSDRAMLELMKLARRDSIERRLRIMKTTFPDILQDAQFFTAVALIGFLKPTKSDHKRLEAIRRTYIPGDGMKLPKGGLPFLTQVFREGCWLCEQSDNGQGDDPTQQLDSTQTRASWKGAHR